MRLAIEKYWPATVCVGCLLAIGLNESLFNYVHRHLPEYYDRSLTISTTLLGFFLTVYTIITTVNTRRIQFVKDVGAFPRLMKYLADGIVWQVINISLFLLEPAFAINGAIHLTAKPLTLFVLFAMVFSWTLSVRFTYIFLTLLSDPKT